MRRATGWRGADLDAGLAAAKRRLADVNAALETFVPVDADVYERLAAATERTDTSAWNRQLRRVLARVVVDREGVSPSSRLSAIQYASSVLLPVSLTGRAKARGANDRFALP